MKITKKSTFLLTIILILFTANISLADDKQRANKLINKGLEDYNEKNYKEAAKKWEEALEISKRLGHQKGISAATGNLGAVYYHLGEYSKAIENYELSLEIDRGIGDKKGEALDLANLGNIYKKLREDVKALNFYAQAFKIYKEIGNKKQEEILLGKIDNLFDVLKTDVQRGAFGLSEREKSELIKSIESHKELREKIYSDEKKLKRIRKKISDYEGKQQKFENLIKRQKTQELSKNSIIPEGAKRAFDLFDVGIAHYNKSEFRKAVRRWEEALLILERINHQQGIGAVNGNMGLAFYNLGNILRALEHFQLARQIHRTLGDKKRESTDLNNIGYASGKLGSNNKKARKAFLEYKLLCYVTAIEIGGFPENSDIAEKDSMLNELEKRMEEENISNVYVIKKTNEEQRMFKNLKKQQEQQEYPKVMIAKEDEDEKHRADKFFEQGVKLYEIGLIRSAVMNWKTALIIYKRINDWAGVITVMSNLCANPFYIGSIQKAFEYCEKLLEICRVLDDKKGEGRNLGSIAYIYLHFGKYTKALEYLEQAKEIYRKLDDKKGEEVIMNNFGVVYGYLGDHTKALEYYEQVLEICRRNNDKHGKGISLGNIGSVYLALSDYTKALEYLEQTKEIMLNIKHREGYRAALERIGDIHLLQGNYKKAKEIYENVKVPGKLGSVYNKLGDFQKALLYYEKSLKREIENGRPSLLVEDYIGLGEAQEGLDRIRDAINSYAKAVSIVEKIRSSLIKEGYRGEHKTGFLSANLKPYQHLSSTLAKLHLKGASLDDPNLRKYGHNYGDVSFYFAENTKTRLLIEILAKRKGAGTSYKLPEALYQKEQQLVNQIAHLNEQLEDAFKKDRELFKKKKDMINTLEAELEQFIYDLRKDYPEYAALKYPQPLRLQDVPLSPGEVILEYHVSEKATYLFVVGQNKRGSPQTPLEGTNHKTESNSATFNDASLGLLTGQGTQRRNNLLRLIEISISREELREKVRAFRRPFEDIRYINEFDPMKAKELYDLLLAEGVKGLPQDSHLIIIPDGILSLLPFEALVVKESPLPPLSKGGNKGDLAKGDKGDLRGLQVVGKDSNAEIIIPGYKGVEYFGDKWTTSYYQSATVLGLNRTLGKKEQKWSNPLFALGDPIFDNGDIRYVNFLEGKSKDIRLASLEKNELSSRIRGIAVKVKGYTFPRLIDTRDEVIQIGQTLNVNDPSHIKLDMDASEAEVKDADLSGYRYVHLATHGILGNEIPYILEPALVLNLVHNTDEDGYLTMSEVMGLSLSADMVMLSACKTGLGEDVGGEGVVGLTRAFMYAGTPSVVVSLWSVASKSTTDFMTSMYQYLEEGKNKAEAVRLAKMDLRKKQYRMEVERGFGGIETLGEKAKDTKTVTIEASHPYFWAPFILVGEWEGDSGKSYKSTNKDNISTSKFIEGIETNKIDEDKKRVDQKNELKSRWLQWQDNMKSAYNDALRYDNDVYLSASKKAEVWQRIIDGFSHDNPYSTEDLLIQGKARQRRSWNTGRIIESLLL